MKIPANELRLGNYYRVSRVDSFGEDIIYVEAKIETLEITHGELVDPISPEPIPLTEGWLKKFGFDNKDYKKGYIGIDVNHTDFVLCYPKTHIEHSKYFCWEHQHGRLPMFNEFKWVHELQNLYFAITGEELTIK